MCARPKHCLEAPFGRCGGVYLALLWGAHLAASATGRGPPSRFSSAPEEGPRGGRGGQEDGQEGALVDGCKRGRTMEKSGCGKAAEEREREFRVVVHGRTNLLS